MLSIFVEGTGNGLCSERKPVRACKIIKNSKIRFEISLFVKYYVSFFFPFLSSKGERDKLGGGKKLSPGRVHGEIRTGILSWRGDEGFVT